MALNAALLFLSLAGAPGAAQFDSYSSPYRYTGRLLDQKVRAGVFATENVFLLQGGRWAGSANDFTLGLVLGVEPR